MNVWTFMACAALASACTRHHDNGHPTQHANAAPHGPAREIPPGLLVGEFALGQRAILDGDTIRVVGLSNTLRLLGIDTEETFKYKKEWRAYDAGFEAYLLEQQAHTHGPVKCATPLGMDAKVFAETFFHGVTHVRVERDHPRELRDRYDRMLAYVLIERNGQWLNYNVEAVRAGMSPYFPKYGYSRRFHEAFVQAQDQARAAKIGIWDPTKEHYPDYPERLAWWEARGAFVDAFERDEAQAQDPGRFIKLDQFDAWSRLLARDGQEVEVLGLMGGIYRGKGTSPTRISLAHKAGKNLSLVVHDERLVERTGLAVSDGEHVRVRGTIAVYTPSRGPHAGEKRPKIEIRRPEQVQVSGAGRLARPVTREQFSRLLLDSKKKEAS